MHASLKLSLQQAPPYLRISYRSKKGKVALKFFSLRDVIFGKKLEREHQWHVPKMMKNTSKRLLQKTRSETGFSFGRGAEGIAQRHSGEP